MDSKLNNKQIKSMELLGIKIPFTKKELTKAYFKAAGETHPDKHPESEANYWDKKMAEVNNAYEVLQQLLISNSQPKHKHTAYTDKTSVFTTECCRKLGLTLETAQAIYKKNVRLGYQLNFDDWLKKRLSSLRQYEILQAEVLKECQQSIMLQDITFQHIINLYECDCEFGGCDTDFSNWLSNLINTCKEMETKLLKKNYLSIMMEIKDYIADSSKRNFIEILKEKQEIREMCQELGQEVYETEYKYDYSDFRGTFKEYLQNEVNVSRIFKDMGMTQKEADLYYELYLTHGYSGSKLEFLKEAQAVLPFGAILGTRYFSLKKQYDNLPKTEKPESFIFWAELELTKHLFQKSPEQILECIYTNSKEAGYDKSLQDLLMSLGGRYLNVVKHDDDILKEEEQPEEMVQARKI